MNLLSHVGKLKGSFKNKDNRSAKLLYNWDALRIIMEKFIVAGNGSTLRARCAYGILLTMKTGIRVGNETSAEGYVCDQKYHALYGKTINVYGLTTLRKEHVSMSGGIIHLNFLGKKAVQQELRTSNSILLRYYSSVSSHGLNTWLGIDYGDIYHFVKRSIGRKIKPKDIRTAAVNMLFIHKAERAKIMQQPFAKKADANKALKMIVEATATEIGHTSGVCKSAYISKNLYTVMKERLYDSISRMREKNKKSNYKQ